MNALIIGNNTKHAKLFSMFCDKVFLLLQNENDGVYRTSEEMEDYEHIFSNLRYGTIDYKTYRAKEIRRIIREKNISIVFSNRKDDMICSKIATLGMHNKPLLLVTYHNSYAWQNQSKVKILSMIINMSTDGVVCLSRFMYKALLNNKVSSRKLLYLPNTIQYENFKKKSDYSFRDDNIIRICYTAVISRGKNQEVLVEVVNCLKNQFKFEVSFYGDIIEQDYFEMLKKKISRYGLENSFIFYGRVDYEEIKSKLCENDLYFSTTKLEMSPYNILEAKACALPIIASNVPGQKDLIEDRIDGVLYDVLNIGDASKKLLEVIQDLQFRRNLGENAYTSVSNTKSYKVAAKKLKEFSINIRKYSANK